MELRPLMRSFIRKSLSRLVLATAFFLTTAVYWQGLNGGFLFDDYPNIVDNEGVQPHRATLSQLVQAALSSPSSDFKRPLASLSFAVNYLLTDLDPYWMKLTNLVIHLLNGALVFLLVRSLLRYSMGAAPTVTKPQLIVPDHQPQIATLRQADTTAALIAAGWMLIPINLTSVLYIVQRMESMANLFVLIGLIGYVIGRKMMLAPSPLHNSHHGPSQWLRWIPSRSNTGFILCSTSITVPAAIGVLAKETAVMLPLYALLIEWACFRFEQHVPERTDSPHFQPPSKFAKVDRRLIGLFLTTLALPFVVGLVWVLPGVVKPSAWATRDFTMGTRLLSEARVVVDYIFWTLLPTPHDLSFYHDDFNVSTGLLSPWTTLACIIAIAGLIALSIWLRPRFPMAALGIGLFLGCHLLTATVLPLELIYEHRNYFASLGLLLALIPLLAAPSYRNASVDASPGAYDSAPVSAVRTAKQDPNPHPVAQSAYDALPFALPRYALLLGLLTCWTILTAVTAHAWGNPLLLAEELAMRAPQSSRAQYELGRTYIIYSKYDPSSPFTTLAYAPLERAAAIPGASILPEQALIYMNSHMRIPVKDAWWKSLVEKLKARKAGVQDESSLGALTDCLESHQCDFPKERLTEAYLAALSHPDPSARLSEMYGSFAWNVLGDRDLGLRMAEEAVAKSPNEPAYRITVIRMQVVMGQRDQANKEIAQLMKMNIGGRLDSDIAEARRLVRDM
jgi:protein O-mannosyl-transferase